MENEKMESEETKKTVIEKYLEECGTTIDKLKEKIARESIDFSGNYAGNYSLLVRILRGRNYISTDYYQSGEDGHNDHDRFRFEFSRRFYGDLPSGYDVSHDDQNEDYVILDRDKVMGRISFEDLRDELVDDLIVRNEGKFSEEFEEFLQEFYTWIIEVE